VRISASKKCYEKTPPKIAKICFLYSQEYRDHKWGEKRAKQFFQKHTNSARKICWGKNRWKKVRKHVFYIHTNIVTKKRGKRTRETIFPETHQWCEQKMLGKNRRKRV